MWNQDIFEDMRQLRCVDPLFFGKGFVHLIPIQSTRHEATKTGETAPAGAMQLWRAPRCEVTEAENSFIAQFELPGADKNDIELNIAEQGIEVKVEKKLEQKGMDTSGYKSARQSFYRHITMPAGIDISTAKAEYRDGMLTVEIPKAAKAKAKRLEIT